MPSNSIGLTNPAKTHIARLVVGRPTSASILNAKKLYGSSIKLLFDSLVDATDTTNRKCLSKSFGFNQKAINFLGRNFCVTANDYNSFYKASFYETPSVTNQVPYGLVIEECINIKILSSNTFNNMLIKLHVVKLTDHDITPNVLFHDAFNKTKDVQDYGSIPKAYQYSDRQSDYMMGSVLCDLKTSLNYSARFKVHSKIVKTLSKKLGPQDVFDFRFVNKCGSGVRLDILKDYLEAGGKGEQPSSYMFIIEAQGYNCEAVRPADNSKFIGSAPGWYTVEATKSVELVSMNNLIDTGNLSVLEDPNFDEKYCIKIYQNERLKDKRYNVNANLIGPLDDPKTELSIVGTSATKVVVAADAGSKSDITPPPNGGELNNMMIIDDDEILFDDDEEDLNDLE